MRKCCPGGGVEGEAGELGGGGTVSVLSTSSIYEFLALKQIVSHTEGGAGSR